VIQSRAQRTTQEIQDIAWKAQTRLCSRYRKLEARGKLKVQVSTAVARERGLQAFDEFVLHGIFGCVGRAWVVVLCRLRRSYHGVYGIIRTLA
jgi:hypothetical protein